MESPPACRLPPWLQIASSMQITSSMQIASSKQIAAWLHRAAAHNPGWRVQLPTQRRWLHDQDQVNLPAPVALSIGMSL
jgi:hypothetical protein